MRTATINDNGLQQIAQALAKYHKLGAENLTVLAINARAQEAERSFDAGNGMTFEIRARDSVTGRPEEVTISPDGYDFQELSDDE